MDFEKKNNNIFNSPLVESDININAQELKNNLNYIIRSESLDKLAGNYNKKIEGELQPLELVEVIKNLFDELEDKYDILVPVNFVVGVGESDEKLIYSVVDKIIGQNLVEYEGKENIRDDVANLYVSISNYFLDKLRGGGFFLTDINNPAQYVYGKSETKKSSGNKIYFIDTDIYLDNRRESLVVVVYWLARHIIGVEKQYKIKLNEARENIRVFVGEFVGSGKELKEKDEKRVREIRNFLNDKRFGEVILPAIPTFE